MLTSTEPRGQGLLWVLLCSSGRLLVLRREEEPPTPRTLVVAEFLGVSMFHQLSASLETGWGTEAGSLA